MIHHWLGLRLPLNLGIAEYVHFKQSSAQVAIGDLVEQGTTIAASGSSGTTKAHLHLSLLPSTEAHGKTIPLNFSNAASNEWGLQVGESYEALE